MTSGLGFRFGFRFRVHVGILWDTLRAQMANNITLGAQVCNIHPLGLGFRVKGYFRDGSQCSKIQYMGFG